MSERTWRVEADRAAGVLERLLAVAVRGRSARGHDRRVVGGAGGGMVVHAAARCGQMSSRFTSRVSGLSAGSW